MGNNSSWNPTTRGQAINILDGIFKGSFGLVQHGETQRWILMLHRTILELLQAYPSTDIGNNEIK